MNAMCKLHVQICVVSCQSKFEVHEVMNSVADLKIHLRDCTGNQPRHDKTNKMTVSPAKTQISLGMHPV